MDLKDYLRDKRVLVDRALKTVFPEPEGPSADLVRAMTYSLFAGGKRLRPILCIAGAEAVGKEPRTVLAFACGLELIHTYSLIHDDLPAMDNDDLRRGKPTNHKVFGEALALLAGDGLLTEAFRLMAAVNGVDPRSLLRVIQMVGSAAGYQGMVGGQVVDIQSEGKPVDPSLVDYIHSHKTGALIHASVTSGAILGLGTEEQVKAISSYGDRIGLAFQIADDILDVEGDSKTMGKGVGGDAKKKKITFPGAVGLQKAKEIQSRLVEEAVGAMKIFDQKADPLRSIAVYIIERKK
ncbi:MAG: polyprenyl synthetase family protein [Deltaproteobacteria bacterium]